MTKEFIAELPVRIVRPNAKPFWATTFEEAAGIVNSSTVVSVYDRKGELIFDRGHGDRNRSDIYLIEEVTADGMEAGLYAPLSV